MTSAPRLRWKEELKVRDQKHGDEGEGGTLSWTKLVESAKSWQAGDDSMLVSLETVEDELSKALRRAGRRRIQKPTDCQVDQGIDRARQGPLVDTNDETGNTL